MSREVVNKTGGVEVNGRLYFGMDAELALKAQQNYDYGLEREIAEWIEGVLGKKLPNRDFAESLKSGVILCELLNVIRPNTIKKINTRSIALMEIENIKLYLEGCWKLGVPSGDLFVSSDLYNKKSMQAVLQNLTSLSRLAARIPSYSGPLMASHSRSSSSSSSSSSSTPSKPPPKKWDTINIGQPKFVTDNQPVESIDLRSEIVKLQQELDRERFDRAHLEKKLESLSSPSPSPSINNNNNNNNNNIVVKSSEEDKREIQRLNEKIARMEKEIEGLNNQLQAAVSGKESLGKSEKENGALRSSLSSLEKDITKLKDDLNREKLAHDKSKRDLNDQKSSVIRLEATIQDLKSQISSLSKSPTPSPSPSPAPANNNNNNGQQQAEISRLNQRITQIENQYFDERTVHNQLKNEYNRLVSDLSLVQSENKKLLRQIQDLDDANSLLKKSSSSSSSSNSQSEQRLQQKIRSLEDQLFDEKTVHNHLKSDHSSLQKELQSLRDTITKQLQQINDLQHQISSSPSSPANKENKAGSQPANNNNNNNNNISVHNPNNVLQRKNTESSRLLARNYFILDYEEDGNEFEANKELSKRVWDCLHNLLHSKYVDFADVVELNRFFKIDAGRRKFTQMLELTMQEAPTLTLTDSAFELLLYLVNTTLTEMDLSDSADLITAKILMKASSILKRTVNNKEEYIMDFIKSYQVWKQQTFWEELFWEMIPSIEINVITKDELFKKHKQRSLSNSESEDEDLYTMDHNLTVFILELISSTMIHWNVHKDQIYQFVVNMCMQTKLPESETSKMLAKMNNDNYWIIDPSSKLKQKKQKKQNKKQKKQSKK